ncbi:MAG: orotidine-5'-phosphate decarboxylase [Thermoplasmatota archaeon]
MERGLVLALDVLDGERALRTAKETAPHIDAVKVGLPLVLGSGLGVVTRLSRLCYVLCDFKVADIPSINRIIASEAFRAGARGLIVHAFPGSDSLSAAVDEAARAGGEVFAVTEMSHPGATELMAGSAEEMARMAVRSGAAGIVAPATRPERVRALRCIVGELKILSPGVGAQGGSAESALLAGADAVIVGRSICESPRPGEAARRLAEEAMGAMARKRGGP